MRFLSPLFFVFLTTFVSCAQEKVPRSYIVYQTDTPIIIDGKGNESAWQKAPWTDLFIDIEGVKKPKYDTRMKMLWDNTYFYFYAKMEEPHIWGNLKQRDTVIFYNNDFEIFIDPDGDTHNYYEFEMNALNTVWDLFIVKPYREPAPIVDSWDIQGLKTAVYIDGTLNNPNDKDRFWSVEIAIPWKVLEEANVHNNIPVKEFWRVNFSRVNWDFDFVDGKYDRKKDIKGTYLPEYNWVWSPQGVINMHEPERWGYAYFSEKYVGEKDSFSIPEEEKIRWHMYAMYRQMKAYESENGKYADDIKLLKNYHLDYEGKTLVPELELHKTGWNIHVKHKDTDYYIKEDGKFIKKIHKNTP